MSGESRGRQTTKTSAKERSRSRSRQRAEKIGKKVKGLIKGISRRGKKKNAGGASTDGASTAVSIHQTPEETTPNPAVEQTPVPEKRAPSLQLVLLLMDPSTRRFELLQLEFDSDKARVSDILAQIPVSVTEDAIRDQKYDGVIDESIDKKDESIRLVDFCSGKKVLVALPKDLPVKECSRLARPILCDVQVERMLKSSGFDVSGWGKKDDDTKEETQERALPTADASKEASSEGGSSVFPVIAIFALLAIVVQAAHSFISAPIEIGVQHPPGTWKSKCGLLGYLPKVDFLPPCTNSFLQVHDDGTVSLYDDDGEIEKLMVGAVCSTEGCVEGLVMNEDRTVSIGGKVVKSAKYYGDDSSLSPWPFKEEPKMKMRRF